MDDYARVLAALDRLREEGSPIPTPDNYDQLAKVALRRWRSFQRRSRGRIPSRADRIRDLARGLADALEKDRGLVGPLMRDYEHVAEVLAPILEPANDGTTSSV